MLCLFFVHTTPYLKEQTADGILQLWLRHQFVRLFKIQLKYCYNTTYSAFVGE
jgi:hypothetical protein